MTEHELIEKINQSSEKSIRVTPRELLRCFGQERRSKFNNLHIKQFLQDNELVSSPDFLSVYMDVHVELKKKPKAKMTISEKEEAVDYDPVSRIQLLESANRFPVTIKKECSIREATTLMLMHDYSQLPVMNGTRHVDGLINWETIGNNLIHGGDKSLVKDFMKKDVTIIPDSTTLFDAVKFIIQNEVVLIKNDTSEICGLVTATDISQQFVTISEPFLILEQIENHIRKLLEGKFSVDKLKEVANEEERSGRIESISDLTFGEYIRLMESPENWEEMKLSIDRSTFVKRLEEIRRIRNDVMHFHPDGIGEKDFDILRKTSSFFESLAGYMK